MMKRRDLLKILATIPVTLGAKEIFSKYEQYKLKINLNYVGMKKGHFARDFNINYKDIKNSGVYEVVVVGSGIAALTTIWKLIIEGYNGKIALITGPEKFGNSSDIKIGNSYYPTGAHYLPIQNEETFHVKEILKFFNVIVKDENTNKPYYNDDYLVNSPMERVLYDNQWEEGIYKKNETMDRFVLEINKYKNVLDKDNKKLFAIPSILSSKELIELDKKSFKDWLIEKNLTDPFLDSYLNYCSKDDYGVGVDKISAWAGIHYFAGRTGECKNMIEETILTWKNGNAFLAKSIFDYIKNKITVVDGTVLNINKNKEILIKEDNETISKMVTKDLVVATPLHMVNYLFKEEVIKKELQPNQAIWVVSNFLFKELPTDIYKGCDIAYDNIVQKSANLGYIYSDNLTLDISMENKVLTTYFCIDANNIKEARKKLLDMSKEDYFELASKDLFLAYGDKIMDLISSVDINIRAHAMSYPEVGFQTRRFKLIEEIESLEKQSIYFAHSDISSISIFEEASWWGYNVAKKILSKEV